MLITVKKNYPFGDGDKAKSINVICFPYILSVLKTLFFKFLKTRIEFLILCVCLLLF